MAERHADCHGDVPVTREDLVALLNGDLAREYQAVISYVVYSQTLKGAAYMNVAAELASHAAEELSHALILAGQIDYLGGMPETKPLPVKTSARAEDMLRFDLEAETETIHHYRQRVQQCEALGGVRDRRTYSRHPGAGARSSGRPGQCLGNRSAQCDPGQDSSR